MLKRKSRFLLLEITITIIRLLLIYYYIIDQPIHFVYLDTNNYT